MSDAEEFLEEASKPDTRKTGKSAKNLAKSTQPSNPIGYEDSEDVPQGKLCQYSFNGEGFSPTSSTIKYIPGGIYEIEIVNHMLTFLPKNVVTDSLIRLPDSRSDEVINRIKKFWTLKEEFRNGNENARGGYLHKLGIMLFGPPGSGKTCTIKFIMQDIIERGGIVILANTSPGLIAQALSTFRQIEIERPVVVVLEDFDELVAKYTESDYLALLDGESSIDGALFIATTNYPSRLDARLYNRPGRFSDVIKIGMPNVDARRMYLTHGLKKSAEIEKIIPLTEGFSIDHLKALILGVYFEGRPLESEIKRLRTLFKPPKDDQGNEERMGII